MILLIFLFLAVMQAKKYTTPQQVVSMPSYGNIENETTIYSGYVTVNEDNGRNLYYLFVEATGDKPESKPLVMWLNGGPGCSSGLGFISEHGPYNLYPNGKVIKFPWSLNNFANVIYVDSPAGAGYSYEVNRTDYEHGMGDDRTTEDLYTFLQIFLKDVFPEYSKNEFQVWGESYGGHYVPLISSYIIDKQKSGQALKDGDVEINLQGMAVNNGDYDSEHNLNGDIWWMFGHAVISYNQLQSALKACKGNFYQNQKDKNCKKWIDLFFSVQMKGLLNLDLEADCYKGVNGTFPGEVIPCWNSEYLDDYFNQQEAYDAFHVSDDFFKYTKKWETCNTDVAQYYLQSYESTISYLKTVYEAGKKMLIMNGDVDDNCSNLANQLSINSLLGEELQDFPQWYYSYPETPDEYQVGGFYQMKKNLIFATVRGAGHMVSTYRPYRSFILYEKFFSGTFPN